MSTLGKKVPRESSQFLGIPEAILSCLSCHLKSFPAGFNVSASEEMMHNSDTVSNHCKHFVKMAIFGKMDKEGVDK